MSAVAADSRLVSQNVLRFDDERVAFPAAARISHVGLEVRSHVRGSIQRNDPRFVDHLLKDGNIAGSLNDLGPVAVDYRKD